jgi:hypothetical protein
VDERVYDNEFDDVKTDAAKREVPYDKHGVILGAIREMRVRNKEFADRMTLFLPTRSARRLIVTICFIGM